MRFPLSRYGRLSLALVFSLGGVGFFGSGCSEQSSANQAADAPVKVETSQMFVKITNDSGMPLTDVLVEIIPKGAATIFSTNLGRIENSESRNIMLGDFRGRDGTPFSLRVIRPNAVHVKGKDVMGKDVAVEVGWK